MKLLYLSLQVYKSGISEDVVKKISEIRVEKNQGQAKEEVSGSNQEHTRAYGVDEDMFRDREGQ